MAIDHGQFSFVDVKHGEWPIIFVTNPKTAILVPPVKYSFIPISSHIRFVITYAKLFSTVGKILM